MLGLAAAKETPQDRQNFFPGVIGEPQLGQTCSRCAPQSSQKRAAPSFSAWHRGHRMPNTLSTLIGGNQDGAMKLACSMPAVKRGWTNTIVAE